MNHLIKLVDATHILSGISISQNQLKSADQMLKSFVDEFEELYGESNMVYNVHQLRHISECVKRNGPLFAYSNYCMEDNIGHLVSHVKGTTDVLSQISTRYILEKNLHIHLEKTPTARKYYEQIESKLSFPIVKKVDESLVIGKARSTSNLSEDELSFIRTSLSLRADDEIFEYNALLFKNKIFYQTHENSFSKRTNDSFIYNANSKRYADIKSIFCIREKLYFFVSEKYEFVRNDSSRFIKILKELRTYEQNIMDSTLVGPKYVLVKFHDTIACSAFPNMFERN